MKPENYTVGVLVLPIDAFWAWAQTNLPGSQFYTMGKIVVEQNELKIGYSASSAGAPPPPAAVVIDQLLKALEKDHGATQPGS